MLHRTSLEDLKAGDENSTTGPKTSAQTWQPRLDLEIALRNIEDQLAADPGAIPLHFERACLLDQLGQTLEARDAYLKVLAVDPSHRVALNNLGTLLHATKYRSAARIAYTQAVARHPDDPTGHVNLANMLRESGEWAQARDHYEKALQLEPNHSEAHQGLSYVLSETGDGQGAAWHRQKGFGAHPVITLPYRGEGPPVSLLLLVSAIGGNTPTTNLLDDRTFQTSVLFTEFYTPQLELPPHQIVFNAVSDADLTVEALLAAQSALAHTTAPIINAPSSVMGTDRVANAQRLSRLPDVCAPLTVTVPREALTSPDILSFLASKGFSFPLLVRTPGCHTGQNFIRVLRPEDLFSAITQLPGPNLTVMQYFDTREADGKIRKYRVMLVDGKIYPLHVAISSHWKIHYFTAEMLEPQHRAEDAAFLADMPGVLGPRAVAALARIQAALGLDYAGVDFGLSASGEVIVFEANATMVVNPPEPGELWAYRIPAVGQIYAAVRGMLLTRAGRSPGE